MAEQQWFVVRGEKEEGPISGTRLKEMALSGKLKPTDLVRRADVEVSRPASAIKGLFPSEMIGTERATKPQKSPVLSEKEEQKDSMKMATRKKLLVLSSIAGVCFFLCCGGFGVIALFGNRMQDAARKELAEADARWDKGDKADAVQKYSSILGSRAHYLKEEDRPRVYGRVIDFDMENGNAESARTLLAEAVRNKVTPTVGHPEAKVMLAAAQRGQRTKSEQDFKWQQPEGWWGDALKSSNLQFRSMPIEDYAELIETLNTRTPEKVAKLLHHVDPHALFTRDELRVMARPYYGVQLWNGSVEDGNHPNTYTEVQSKSGRKDKYREPLFLVSGELDQNVGGLISGNLYRGYELREERRTKFIQKAVFVKLDFNVSGPDLKRTGIKAAQLHMLVIHIPAIFNDEKCYGWDAMIVTLGNRVGSVRLIERREERFGIMADPKFGPADADLYRINYNGDEYEIEKPFQKREIIRGR